MSAAGGGLGDSEGLSAGHVLSGPGGASPPPRGQQGDSKRCLLSKVISLLSCCLPFLHRTLGDPLGTDSTPLILATSLQFSEAPFSAVTQRQA